MRVLRLCLLLTLRLLRDVADPTAADQALILALVEREAQARLTISVRLNGVLHRLLVGFDAWYDEPAVHTLASRIAAVVRTAQVQQGHLSGQFQQHVLQVLNADVRRPQPIALPESLRGLDDPTVPYQRPFAEYRRLRAQGMTPQQARDAAEKRAQRIADDDLMLAARDSAIQRLFESNRVTGYRRVLHPELSRGGSCGLCIVASDRTYRRDRLMPIHSGCHCGVLPVVGGFDPGANLNRDDLKRIYAAAGGTGRDVLKRVRVKTRMHGELGPVLVDASHHFRTEAEANADLRS